MNPRILVALVLLCIGSSAFAEKMIIYTVPYGAAASDNPTKLLEAIRKQAPDNVLKISGGVVKTGKDWSRYREKGVEVRIAHPERVHDNYRKILTILQRYLKTHRMKNRSEIIRTLQDLKEL
jgi:hypothetical protein